MPEPRRDVFTFNESQDDGEYVVEYGPELGGSITLPPFRGRAAWLRDLREQLAERDA